MRNIITRIKPQIYKKKGIQYKYSFVSYNTLNDNELHVNDNKIAHVSAYGQVFFFTLKNVH